VKSKLTRKKSADEKPTRSIADNRQARFRFELLDRWEAGIVLLGGEVKSLRAGQVNMGDAHVIVKRGEAWLMSCHVAPYAHATHDQPDPLRPRKLLLHAIEVARIDKSVREKGMTVVPTRLYFVGARVKVEIALARGKKLHDKRETIKKRDQERDARRGEGRS
jgi:SsrA-binding protein